MSSRSDVIRAYFAACEARDISVVERLFDPEFVSRASDGTSFGIAGQRAKLTDFCHDFDRISLEIHTLIESGDLVATHYTHCAILRRTGEQVVWKRIVIHRVVGDRIVESLGVSDRRPLAEAHERDGLPRKSGDNSRGCVARRNVPSMPARLLRTTE